MAGYSGTPLVKKLGIKEGTRVAFVGAPADFAQTLGRLPEGVSLLGEPRKPLDLVVLFAPSMRELRGSFARLAQRLASAGSLWVAWPKKSSGVVTDLAEDVIRDHGLEVGLVDVKVCAIDETWSGLKFVIRLKDRAPVGLGKPIAK